MELTFTDLLVVTAVAFAAPVAVAVGLALDAGGLASQSSPPRRSAWRWTWSRRRVRRR